MTIENTSQKKMLGAAQEREFIQNRTFTEIQSGPHPLTSEEIKHLATKYPARWGRFHNDTTKESQ